MRSLTEHLRIVTRLRCEMTSWNYEVSCGLKNVQHKLTKWYRNVLLKAIQCIAFYVIFLMRTFLLFKPIVKHRLYNMRSTWNSNKVLKCYYFVLFSSCLFPIICLFNLTRLIHGKNIYFNRGILASLDFKSSSVRGDKSTPRSISPEKILFVLFR